MWNRIIGPTLLVVLCWLAFVVACIFTIVWEEQYRSRLAAESDATIMAADAMQSTIWQMQSLASVSDRGNVAEIKKDVALLYEQIERHLGLAERTSATAGGKKLCRDLRGKFESYKAQVEKRLAGGAASSSNDNLLVMAGGIAASCADMRGVNEHLAAQAVNRLGRFATAVALLFLGILIVGTTGGMLWQMHTATDIGSSISQISISLSGADSKMQEELGSIGLSASGDLAGLREQVDMVADRIRHVVDELQEERRKLILASRLAAAGELAAGVAHEIRNPLTAVKLLLHAVTERSPTRTVTEQQAKVISGEIARMEKIVQGLLDFARPPQVHRVQHDLRATVAGAIQLVEGAAARQEVNILQHLPIGETKVDADPAQLHQVFVNLLLNALEAIPSGGSVHVVIQRDVIGGMYRVLFQDSGPGIPAAIMERLFEPFVSSKQRGTGLGLAISRRLIKEHGGNLTAMNLSGGGAELVVELPIVRAGERGRLPAADPALRVATEIVHV